MTYHLVNTFLMAGKSNKEPMSVWGWVWTLIVLALPCIGFLMTILWAIIDGNESRRNFCRATILIWCIVLLLYLFVVLLGFGPSLAETIRDQLKSYR